MSNRFSLIRNRVKTWEWQPQFYNFETKIVITEQKRALRYFNFSDFFVYLHFYDVMWGFLLIRNKQYRTQ